MKFPLLLRFFNRINNQNINTHQVYNDNQNIHNSNIQQSIKTSLANLLNDRNLLDFKDIIDYILDSNIIDSNIKQEILNYCDDNLEHSLLLVTFKDIFHYVVNRIIKSKESDELLKILNNEMKDTICKCFTGRISRLINVLNGFYDDINITINSSEQISNIIIKLKEQYKDEELKNQFRKELLEREYSNEVIE